VSSCQDYLWKDSSGSSCTQYITSGHCSLSESSAQGTASAPALYFQQLSNKGIDATKACCACGGGITGTLPNCPALSSLQTFGECSNLLAYISQAEAVWGPKIFCNITYLQATVVSVASTQWSSGSCSNNPYVFSVLNCAYNAYHTTVASTMTCQSPGSTFSTASPGFGIHLLVSFQMVVPSISTGVLSQSNFLNSFQQILSNIFAMLPSQIVVGVDSESQRRLFSRSLQISNAPTITCSITPSNQAQWQASYITVLAIASQTKSGGTWSLLQEALAVSLLGSSLARPQISQFVSNASIPALAISQSACQDVLGWSDIRSSTCSMYESSNYCTSTGGYGSGWFAYAGAFTFTQLAIHNIAATKACCVCGGGKPIDLSAQITTSLGTGGPVEAPGAATDMKLSFIHVLIPLLLSAWVCIMT